TFGACAPRLSRTPPTRNIYGPCGALVTGWGERMDDGRGCGDPAFFCSSPLAGASPAEPPDPPDGRHAGGVHRKQPQPPDPPVYEGPGSDPPGPSHQPAGRAVSTDGRADRLSGSGAETPFDPRFPRPAHPSHFPSRLCGGPAAGSRFDGGG